MIDRPATDADLISVLDRLCSAHKIELEFLNMNKEGALALLRGHMRKGSADVGIIGDKPECIFGVFGKQNLVWFIATANYFADGIAAVRFGRRYLRRTAERLGALHAATSSRGNAVSKWLATLGFKTVSDDGAMRTFVYDA